MGYILPITHYTYQNYHRRIMAETKSPHHVGAPYRVTFNKIKDSVNEHKMFQTVLYTKEKQLRNDDSQLLARLQKQAIITEKGQQVNELI